MNPILLNKASEADCKDLWLWRNHPASRKNFFNNKIISWEEHKAWFYSVLSNKDVNIFIAALGGDKIGVIRFEINNNIARVAVDLNPDYFGRGLGWQIISLGTGKILEDRAEIKDIIAEIKKENIASQKSFTKSGYKVKEETNDKVTYVYARK